MLTDLSTYSLPILIVTIYISLLLVIAEFSRRYTKVDSEFTRKIVHIGTGNVILLAWWFHIPTFMIIFASIIASFVAIVSYFLPILPSVNGVGRKSLGTLFYAMSIGILTGLFWENGQQQYTVMGILIMSYGDGMAALIGKKWGKNSYQVWGNKKSWEGSLTMTFVSILITLIVLTFTDNWQLENMIIALIVGIFATILETISYIGIDNLTVPVFGGILIYYLQQFFSL
ncbi:MAG: phosphatidate cytidylyltransferase [Cyanobacteria bacterium]|nr:phosphatidate cytidylyltransferase [Cyanobacteria bacterium CG_2015-16_32_12]NCO78238.1 phosphatidate cytidylyltransferase [Cyanobacteria bacterium CG_2015-22_32_23]NCQ03745.1 phosphatidate cytidylyltransferase [Cyanobacteria bacterium CG_2015-09_32_10]NCQ40618.1 phosphatidate cytidylyltransferase [Cyanobacteria bacterium CG_2015-04_32_10]NCS85173.1 phosphatidate cytidylyltransferase [Cyanobacteria bacterium CG_2015-02_32_10]